MTQSERRIYLIERLIAEQPRYNGLTVPQDEAERKNLLASCYRSCLNIADKNDVKSVAFCCISTGEFHFPNDKAAEIAVKTVKEYKERTGSEIEVIFNVFKNVDHEIYRSLLENIKRLKDAIPPALFQFSRTSSSERLGTLITPFSSS